MILIRPLALALVLVGALAAIAAPMPSNTLYLGAGSRADQAVLSAHRTRVQAQSREIARYRALLLRKGIITPRTVLPRFDTFFVAGTTGRSLMRTRLGAGTLTFAYNGWTAPDEDVLRAFVTRAYPVLVSLYGQPASSAVVTLAAGGAAIEEGEITLDTGGDAITITLGPVPSDFAIGDNGHYGLDLMHLLLHAFHAPALIGLDAWEEGMTRAAAMIAATQLDPSFDPALESSYLLPLYDYLNQPGLTNASLSPRNGNVAMSIWRLGMALSAWLKIYIENPNVFAQFNAQYYAAVTGNAGLAGNQTALKNLLAGVVPMVEGLPLLTWYDNQYVLRPTAIVGKRLYFFEYPKQDDVSLILHYFLTNADGSETPLSGSATVEYHAYDAIPLYPQEGNDIAITLGGDFPGTGALNPGFYNIGGPQRIRITAAVSGLKTSVYYPYGVQAFAQDNTGVVTDSNELFGTLVGADTGDVNITLGMNSLHAAVSQGVFSVQMTAAELGLTYFTPAIFTFSANGVEVSVRRNIGYSYYAPLLVVGQQSAVTLTHTFLAGPALISFPLTPDVTDAATLFNAPADFNFAAWDPTLAGADKYRRYPATPALAPGRGFWLDLPANKTLTMTGAPLPADAPYSLTLEPGWNMIGNMFNADLNPWALVVESGYTGYRLSEAMRLGLVGPVWSYDPTATYQVKGSLSPWEGAWIQNRTGGRLTLLQQGGTRGRAAAEDAMKLLTEGGWGIALRARAGASLDAMAVAGVSTRARQGVNELDWMKPPAFTDGVRLAFIHPARRLAGAVYATDIRPAIGLQGEEWEFEVSSTRQGDVTLSWPDLRGIPAEYQLVLEDEGLNQRRYLRTTPAYSYVATGTSERPDIRRFRLRVTRQSTAPLAFLNMQVVPSRGGGARLQVTMSAETELIMEVRTTSGKLIRVMHVPVPNANEPVLIAWDGRATGGKLVPTGAYLVFLTARTPDGFVIRRTTPMILRR